MTDRVLVRCDGTEETGLGHVSRCLGLAEALAERGVASLFCGTYSVRARGLLAEAGMPTQDACGTGDLARLGVRAIVVDSYAITAEDLAALAPARTGSALLVIDDFAALAEYPAEALVLNFTVGAAELEYRGERLVRLLGPEHLLVRRALRQLRADRRPVRRPPRHVLLALGGGDRFGLSAELAAALTAADPEVTVRLAAGEYGTLPKRASTLAARQLTPGYAWADIAVTGGGLTKYEAAYLGIPPLIISQSDGEDAETQQFAHAGLGVDAGHGATASPHERESMVRSYMHDTELHDQLRRAALRTFPDDPTAGVAETLAGALR